MSKVMVEISELRSKNGEKVENLVKFLKEKVNAKIEVSAAEMTIDYSEAGKQSSKTYLRVLLKKFLHKAELKKDFRIISGKENAYIIKKRSNAAEED